MYYRYEMRTGADKPWQGCFQFFYPDELRYIGKWLKEPKWYQKHPDKESRCWFTDYGFEKFQDIIKEIIQNRLDSNPEWEMRLLQTESLERIVMKGKVQCIQLV